MTITSTVAAGVIVCATLAAGCLNNDAKVSKAHTSTKPSSTSSTTQASKKSHVGPGRVYDSRSGFSMIPPHGWAREPQRESTTQFMCYTGLVDHSGNLSVIALQYPFELERLVAATRKLAIDEAAGPEHPRDGFVTIDGKRSYWLSLTSDHVTVIQYIIPGGNGKAYAISFAAPESEFAKYRPIFEAAAMTAVTD